MSKSKPKPGDIIQVTSDGRYTIDGGLTGAIGIVQDIPDRQDQVPVKWVVARPFYYQWKEGYPWDFLLLYDTDRKYIPEYVIVGHCDD